MFLSSADSIFFKSRAECFSNSNLHALDRYWSINNSHPMHEQMHEIIEDILNTRGEKTIKQSSLIWLGILKDLYQSQLLWVV